MIPISYEKQLASKAPEKLPMNIYTIFKVSVALGFFQIIFSIIFCYAAKPSLLFRSSFSVNNCDTTMQGAIWIQLVISSELLIFSTRSKSLIPNYTTPSKSLFISVFLGCLVVSILAGCTSYFGLIEGTDIVIIWIYNIICLVINDFIKVLVYYLLDEKYDYISNDVIIPPTIHNAEQFNEIVTKIENDQ